MHKCKIFVGNSHPELGKLVCGRLGIEPAPCTLRKFSNGETLVLIGTSVRDEDVYIIQSGLPTVNDHIMELLILILACKTGLALKITAVIPQFPYLKQSKMKKLRGAITARMLANLLIMAGADHVVLMDLHASQMQGFFTKPVDNLYGAPILANWVVNNVPDYKDAVVVSKNPGGTKRVTALADKLKINFAMIHTDRRRLRDVIELKKQQQRKLKILKRRQLLGKSSSEVAALRRQRLESLKESELSQEAAIDENEAAIDEDEDPGDVILGLDLQTARVVKGHIVEDDYEQKVTILDAAEPTSAENAEIDDDDDDDDDDFQYSVEEDNFELNPKGGVTRSEKLITLVGDVKNRPAIILDDMIDKPNLFIAAAEHCRLNCGAKQVIVIATHGIFSNNCLEKLNDLPCIDRIVVTNTYPILEEAREKNAKLCVLDVSPVFAECIRRDHYGESISVLFDSLVT